MYSTEDFILEIYKNEELWNTSKNLIFLKWCITYLYIIIIKYITIFIIELESYHDRNKIHVGWTVVGKALIENFDDLTEKEKQAKSK